MSNNGRSKRRAARKLANVLKITIRDAHLVKKAQSEKRPEKEIQDMIRDFQEYKAMRDEKLAAMDE